jgi:2-methylcitrate dehydratase PrpD
VLNEKSGGRDRQSGSTDGGKKTSTGNWCTAKHRLGIVKKYPTESAAHAAADALRLTINNRCDHRNLRRTTINTLWEHYSQEELPLKALSTQDAYIMYAKNWIVPR